MVKRSAIIVIASIICIAFIGFWLTNNQADEYSGESMKQNEISKNDKDLTSTSEEKNEENEEDKTITEEVREVFSSVVEGARGLFIKEDLDIVAVGDSLTEGIGDEKENGGYVGILEESLIKEQSNQNIEIDNFGKNGNRTDQLLKRLNKKEISKSVENADIVLITIGANDIMKIVKDNFTNLAYEDFVKEQTKYQTRLESIFDTIIAKNPEASIYLVGLFNPFEQYFSHIAELEQIVNDWNDIGKQVTSKYENVSYIPVKDIFQDPTKDLYYEDNFHPNHKGYQLIAERVFEYIKDEVQQIEEEGQL